MLVIRTEAFSHKLPEEFSIDFNKKTVVKGGQKFHLVKIEELGIGYTFLALVYDTRTNRNLYITSDSKIMTMTEE